MTEATETSPHARESLSLKLPEPVVSLAQPWADDVLDRQQLGARLTNLVRTQSAPFTISIHGNWGTGKTFLLKRWQKDLQNENFKAIYFNAWEDDFCSDPLLAILGQMAEYFREPILNTLTRRAIEVALPLLQQNLLGVLNKTTGITFEIPQTEEKTLVDKYLEQRATKNKLKQHLTNLSEAVVTKTEHPLIFIIDELDRCRPNFAVELLERVKHIFDVQNIVFIFGINRDQLCVSFQSEYGPIDTETYLRRFFDIELTLPDVDAGVYCTYALERFGLDKFFISLSAEAQNKLHSEEFQALNQSFPRLCDRLGLSLRDIDFCVSSIAMVGKTLELNRFIYPWILCALILLKLKNQPLYRRFVQRKCFASEVMNYFDEIISPGGVDDSIERLVDVMEAYLYFAEGSQSPNSLPSSNATNGLKLLSEGSDLRGSEHTSERIKRANKLRINNMIAVIEHAHTRTFSVDVVDYVAKLIDLHQSLVRK